MKTTAASQKMKELQVRNRQRAKRINTELLGRMTRALLEEDLGLEVYELAVHLVSASKMAEINQQFLQHHGSTDVITFDYRQGYDSQGEALELAGEIYISVPDAVRQARQFSTTWPEELVRYIVHGLLHLRGHDDLAPGPRKTMKREENRLVRRLVNRFGTSKIPG